VSLHCAWKLSKFAFLTKINFVIYVGPDWRPLILRTVAVIKRNFTHLLRVLVKSIMLIDRWSRVIFSFYRCPRSLLIPSIQRYELIISGYIYCFLINPLALSLIHLGDKFCVIDRFPFLNKIVMRSRHHFLTRVIFLVVTVLLY